MYHVEIHFFIQKTQRIHPLSLLKILIKIHSVFVPFLFDFSIQQLLILVSGPLIKAIQPISGPRFKDFRYQTSKSTKDQNSNRSSFNVSLFHYSFSVLNFQKKFHSTCRDQMFGLSCVYNDKHLEKTLSSLLYETLKSTYSQEYPRVQFAFKDLMIH